jgi:hypothetical protein
VKDLQNKLVSPWSLGLLDDDSTDQNTENSMKGKVILIMSWRYYDYELKCLYCILNIAEVTMKFLNICIVQT